MREKMSKQPPPAPTASATGPCPTIIQISRTGRPGRLPNTFAPPDHPQLNKANVPDTEDLFLDLHLSLSDGFVQTKVFD